MRNASGIARPTVFVAAFLVAGCRDATAPLATIDSVPALTAQNSVDGAPASWTIGPNAPSTFTFGVESATAHGGTHAAFIANAGPSAAEPTFVEIFQLVRADSYAGHRVRLSGWVRSVDVELPLAANASANDQLPFSGLFMRVDGSDAELAVDGMQGRPVLATTAWHQVFVVLDVPGNAVGISLGAVFNGSGQLFVDDLALDTVDVSVPTTTNVIDDPRPMPNIGARYQNAPLAPINLDFETVARVSTSSQSSTRSIAGASRRPTLNGRSGQ